MSDLLVEGAFANCGELLPRVEGAYLDCVSDDLALLLAAKGVTDIRTPFAADWRFDLVEVPGGLPRLDLPPSTQDDQLAERTGWRPRWRPVTSLAGEVPAWQRVLGQHDPIVLVGDAFHLPWLPYRGHEHMSHGFVLDGLTPDGMAHIVDPYDNATQWGRATPLTTDVPLASLRAALDGGRWAVLEPAGLAHPVDPDAAVAANAEAILLAHERGGYDSFVDRHRPAGAAELENLALQSWLLARNRALHGRWLSTVDLEVAGRFDTEVAAGWRRASEMSYLALRRVRAGRQAPTAVFTALCSVAEAETRLAQDLSLARTSRRNPS